MEHSVTLRGWSWSRLASLALGAGMATVAALTMRHFYQARFPSSLAEAAACRADTFFSCGNSALSPVAMVLGVPIGFPGFMVGMLLALGAALPSERLERTNAALAQLNALLALGLTLYSVLVLRSLCLTCTGYTVLALASAGLFWLSRRGSSAGPGSGRWLVPSPAHLAVFGVATLVGAYGVRQYWDARVQARTGDDAARVVHQFFALDTVPAPSVLSPYWTVKSSARFEDAPIRVVEYADLRCSDCRFFAAQMHRLQAEFPGQVNVAFQFFPLEARCNDVVEKDIHPGACDLALMAAYRPDRFAAIHDEVFAHPAEARTPAWRAQLARRYAVEGALTDTATRALVQRLIRTGAEYERTSSQYSHGVRSTPTLIVNGRMIIGTLPDEQMRAIFRAIVDQRHGRGKRFIENWVD